MRCGLKTLNWWSLYLLPSHPIPYRLWRLEINQIQRDGQNALKYPQNEQQDHTRKIHDDSKYQRGGWMV